MFTGITDVTDRQSLLQYSKQIQNFLQVERGILHTSCGGIVVYCRQSVSTEST